MPHCTAAKEMFEVLQKGEEMEDGGRAVDQLPLHLQSTAQTGAHTWPKDPLRYLPRRRG